MTTTDTPVPLLVLDIDGTVRHGKSQLGRFVNGPDDVTVFPEAVKMMRRWKIDGGRIIGVSNQAGIALGHVNESAVAAAMLRTDQQASGLFDLIAWCGHGIDITRPDPRLCWCRKPAPGLVVQTALELATQHPGECYPPYLALMVGDRPEDQQCAAALGIAFQWATDWRTQA